MARKSQRGSGSGHKHNNGQRGAGGCGYKPVRRSQSGGRKQNSRKSRRSKRKSFVLVCDPSNGNCG